MSFADPSLPRNGGTRAEAPAASKSSATRHAEIRRRVTNADANYESSKAERPRGSAYRRSVDWQHVGLVGAGLLIGALVGAGTALLLAPQSGADTRTTIRRKARFVRHRAGDAWDDLAAELAAVARRGRRRARRVLGRVG